MASLYSVDMLNWMPPNTLGPDPVVDTLDRRMESSASYIGSNKRYLLPLWTVTDSGSATPASPPDGTMAVSFHR
jgi:hypothetical protein